ncbi:MAG: tRNA (adenosine(37)-N6)-dimethylallyltransferase MiaA [Bacteroidales bacterium]|nr:tRNA (adenosine(37)-N6)-dimethylallyltransferase MiaA [Bacteroidales bacterium]
MKKKIIFIVGPTAVGKTKIAIELANKLNTEIISADSRQIYKELNIGVARPSIEELSQAKHHFIATKSINDYYNAGSYEVEANKVISDLLLQHNFLIVTGGSGLYINALLYGIDDFPTIEPELRTDLQNKFEQEGIESLRFLLKKLDPVSYNKIDLKNPKRILKCIEVSIQTGKPYSSFLTGNQKQRNYNPIIFVLNQQRQELYDRINKRVEIMFNNGLINEAKNLLSFNHLTPLKTIGYKETFEYLKNNITKEEAIDLIQRNTRKYSRKQINWFKRYENRIDITMSDNMSAENLLKYL